ncbi:putative F-box domain-containing protein [Helianthus debilis subsp. tardiflorus]
MASTSNIKQQERNWLDLPSDVMANILNRIGMIDIFENAEKVCTAWLKICKDPAMWTVINMNDLLSSVAKQTPTNMCRLAVNRSQGQLVDITLAYAYNVTLLYYVAERYVG